jgi:hypothetical protein
MYGRSDKRRGCLAEAGKQQGCVRSGRTARLLPTACFRLLDIDTKFSCFLQADQTGSKSNTNLKVSVNTGLAATRHTDHAGHRLE